MIRDWKRALRELLVDDEAVSLITVVEARGSTPRDEGAWLAVGRESFMGTIGGGALEFDAMARARNLLNQDGLWLRQTIDQPLGPNLGQCCGGHVRLLLERIGKIEMAELERLSEDAPTYHPMESGAPVSDIAAKTGAGRNSAYQRPAPEPPRSLFVYGAGHVGRSLMAITGDLGFDRTWVDISPDRFPPSVPDDIDVLVASDPATAASYAPDNALHLVMTHDHALDQEICGVLLKKGRFGFLGLIGSDTKRNRFIRRLSGAGIDQAMLDQLICPVGIRSITGKDPARVALSIAAQLASL
jgi:xanthine dehydrogenase accessory factor